MKNNGLLQHTTLIPVVEARRGDAARQISLSMGIFVLLFTLLFSALVPVTGTAQVTTVALDLSASVDTVVEINNAPARSGVTCGQSASGNNNCIVFNVTLNPKSDQISFDIIGASGLGSATYQINCGTPYSLATPICLNGITSAKISFCKNGNNSYTYKITVSSSVKGSSDLTLRQNCTGAMSVTGLQASTVNWTSVYPGSAGQYDNYLSCTSGCTSTNVTPQAGAPPYIDYRVYGSTTSCSTSRDDTIRVYTTAPLSVPITPSNPVICSGASITLSASASGGNPPYSYTWSPNNATTSAISVNTGGTYTVSVSDNTSGCLPVQQSATVTTAATPAAPSAVGDSTCSGSAATITASASSGSFEWYDASTGGNQLGNTASYTTNPLTSNATFYVQNTVAGCSSTRTPVSVTVNPIPAAPTASGTTICAGTSTTLTANSAGGGTITWYDSSSGGTLLSTGASFPTPVLNTSTTYYVQTTANSCSSSRTAVTVTVTSLPAAPSAAAAVICAGNTISLTATAPGGTYDWYDSNAGGTLLHTGATFTTPVLNTSATYYVQATVSGCSGSRTAVPVTVTAIPSAPVVSGDTICAGTVSNLTATAPGGTYQWYDSNSGGILLYTGNTFTTPVLNASATYYIQTTLNGCTSSRSSVSVTVNPIPSAPSASAITICAGNTATLGASSTAGGTFEWYDANTAGNLLQTGASFNTPVLSASTTYYVQTTINSCASSRTAVNVTVNPIPSSPVAASVTTCVSSTAILSATSPDGGSLTWQDNTNTIVGSGSSFTTPALTNNTTYSVFATVLGCKSSPTSVAVTVNPIPANPTVSGVTVCKGFPASLSATAPGGTYQWFDAPSGGNLLASGNTFTTGALNNSVLYYVSATINGCTGSRVSVQATVDPGPSQPTVSDVSFCTGTAATLTATAPGGTYQWFDAQTGGNLLGTGSTFTSGTLTQATAFYVQTTVSGCTSSREKVSVTVTPLPASPTVSGGTICAGSSISLSPSAPGGSYQWFDAGSGGNLLFTGSIFNTPALTASTTYYVQTTVAGCTGNRSAVAITVIPTPALPSVNDITICAGSAGTLMATAPGGAYQWFDAASGGNQLMAGSIFNTPVLSATTSFFVQTTVGGCTSSRQKATVLVNPIPVPPVVENDTVCAGTSATLSATGSTGTYEWYDQAQGGVLLSSGAQFITPVLTSTTIYYVQSTALGCSGSRSQAQVTVQAIQNPAFDYGSGTFCITGSNPTPILYGNPKGSFHASPSGLVLADSVTGTINLAASQLGVYQIQYIPSGSCTYPSSARIAVTNAPDASFSYVSPVCAQSNNILPLFSNTANAGSFTAVPNGLNFVSASTGEINLKTSTPGTYTITNLIVASGGCAAASASNTITIDTAATVDAGNDQTVCAGVVVSLSGKIGGKAKTARWSGGGGSFSQAGSLATTYTPAPGERRVVLFLTSDDPAGPCNAVVDSVQVNYLPATTAPTVTSVAVCAGSAASLLASSSGGTYEWFGDSLAANLLSTGAAFTTPSLMQNTRYFVRSVVNGCPGPVAPADVTVSTRPVIVSPDKSAVCSGYLLNYGIQSNLTGTLFAWNRPVIAGIANPAVVGHSDTIAEALTNVTADSVIVPYVILPQHNGCQGDSFLVHVTIYPTPATPAIRYNSPICAGSALLLTTDPINGANYLWNGPDSFKSTLQSPVINSVTTQMAGLYQLRITVNHCTSQPNTVNIFPVIAAPTASSNAPVCNGSSLSLKASAITGASYQWTGPSGFSSALQNPTIASISSSQSGLYIVTASVAGCAGLSDSVLVSVNEPPVTPTINGNTPVCSQDSLQLTAAAKAGTSFQWTGPGGFSSSVSSPLIPKATPQNSGTYHVTASTPGCLITTASDIAVTVNQTPDIDSIKTNSPVCVNDSLWVKAYSLAGATYQWTFNSNNLSATQQVVTSAAMKSDSGIYYVKATLLGCSGKPDSVKINIVQPSLAQAGSDLTVCANNASVRLSGTITGEDTQSGTWASSGTGRFLPDNQSLTPIYVPSLADTTAGSLQLILQSSKNRYCPVSRDTMTLFITPAPKVSGGGDQVVCSNDSVLMLQANIQHASGIKWVSSGSGYFSSANNNGTQIKYTSSEGDIQAGTVRFYLISNGNGNCLAEADTVFYGFQPVPYVYAGPDLVIFEKETAVLHPEVRGTSLQYLWSPADYLSSDTSLDPLLTGVANRTYILQVTGTGACSVTDTVQVKVLKPISIPNVFSPNHDGIHDTWEIPELANYAGSTVDIYTRTGQLIYHSVGYANPWDGTYQGRPVPVATYYYIIRTNFRNQLFSGSVTILR